MKLNTKHLMLKAVVFGILFLMTANANAKERIQFNIVIKNHQFEPAELDVPAGEKIKLIIDNQDPTPEEFESHDLNREKIVGGNKQITVFIGPLKPGDYKYFGEFNEVTAQGVITATENHKKKEK